MKLLPLLLITFTFCSCNSLIKIDDSEDMSIIQNRIEKDYFNILTLTGEDVSKKNQDFLNNKKALIQNINSIGKISEQSKNGKLIIELIYQINKTYIAYGKKNKKSISDLNKAISELNRRNNSQLEKLN